MNLKRKVPSGSAYIVLADGEDGDLGRGCIENGQSRRCSDGASAATFAVDELLGKDLHEVAGFVDTEDELGGVLQRSYPIHDLPGPRHRSPRADSS
eukprot:scaffold26279_cov64-Phaeocystis_antarctica.AAC.3